MDYHAAQKVIVESEGDEPYQVDGDYCGETPLHCRVEPRVVPMITALGANSD